MAVSVDKQPEGHVLTLVHNGALTITSAPKGSGGLRVMFQLTAHGRADGEVLYVKTAVEEYNGFFYANVADANNFSIQTMDIPFGNDSDLDVTYISPGTTATIYRSLSSHGWSCIQLPIQYKLSSTLWPTNEADTVRTISAVVNSNGYCSITASGDIKATGSAAKLDTVKISNSTDNEYDGVYQIISYSSDTSFVINLAYSAAVDTAVTSASIQFYYNNYHVNVEIYGGMPDGHAFEDLRPLELLGEFKYFPDSNNEVIISVNEALKSQLKLRNNSLLGTLPNNLDFWTSFYISVAETYDVPSGNTISSVTSAFVDDDFVGYAAQAKLPFKNIQSGYLSEYYMDNTAGKFLTLFPLPVLFSGRYYDISFIRPIRTEDIGFDLMTLYPFSEWTNEGVPLTIPWTNSTNPSVTMASGETSDRLRHGVSDPLGINGLGTGPYTLTYNVTSSDAVPNNTSLRIRFRKSGVTVSTPNPIVINLVDGANVGSTTFNLSSDVDLVDVLVQDPGGSGGSTTTLNSINVHVAEIVQLDDQIRKQWYLNDVLQDTETETLPASGEGLYRLSIEPDCDYDRLDITLLDDSDDPISETLETAINCDCSNQSIYLGWLNYLGGFDYWDFTAQSEYQIDILGSNTTEQSIAPNWPLSYGEFADTIERETLRTSKEAILVRSQFLSLDQLNAIKYIKTSPVVTIVNSVHDKRTVIVDKDSFKVYDDGDKQYSISFKITYTDNIASQTA